jgi:hypothetical protein
MTGTWLIVLLIPRIHYLLHDSIQTEEQVYLAAEDISGLTWKCWYLTSKNNNLAVALLSYEAKTWMLTESSKRKLEAAKMRFSR